MPDIEDDWPSRSCRLPSVADRITVTSNALRSLGGLLLASSVGAPLALRSGKWQEVRIFTVYMMLFNYPLQPVAVHPLSSDPAGDHFLCRVDDTAGHSWVLRL